MSFSGVFQFNYLCYVTRTTIGYMFMKMINSRVTLSTTSAIIPYFLTRIDVDFREVLLEVRRFWKIMSTYFAQDGLTYFCI